MVLGAIKARINAWKFFFEGNLSLGQAIYLMLPSPLRPKKDARVKLFGKDVIVPNGEVGCFMGLVNAIVTSNQYHAELVKGTVVDAGAHIGIFSIFAAINHPGATIYAFEPAPSTFGALKENVERYPNIKAFNCALGERNGEASLILTGDHEGNHLGENGIPVGVKTIDSLDMEVDFIKMDTEGYEANILEGARETIKKWKPVIVMAAYHKPSDKTELPALLNNIMPYDCELKHDGTDEDFVCKPIL
jgi:FkbM family methyltransferase